jgi:hypothetical protein
MQGRDSARHRAAICSLRLSGRVVGSIPARLRFWLERVRVDTRNRTIRSRAKCPPALMRANQSRIAEASMNVPD